MIPPIVPTVSSTEKKLLSFFKKLTSEDQQTLIKFADFLASVERETELDSGVVTEPLGSLEPKDIPRPKEESVIKAIKRLSQTYDSVDKSTLFNDISALMTEHLMKGREASLIIDELELVFSKAYQKLK